VVCFKSIGGELEENDKEAEMIIGRRIRGWAGIWFLAIVGVSSVCLRVAHADVLQFTIVPPTTNIAAGGAGSFEVLLTNEVGGMGTVIGAFTFSLQSANPDVTFTGANTSTTDPYIFSGNSFEDTFNGGDLTVQTSPRLIASDLALMPGSGTLIMGGQSLALGEVSFAVSATAPTESVAIDFFDTFGTTLADPSGNSVPIGGLTGGSIDITGGGSVVPEPSLSLLVGMMALILTLCRVLKRGSAIADRRAL
jgi:hypothetical protein